MSAASARVAKARRRAELARVAAEHAAAVEVWRASLPTPFGEADRYEATPAFVRGRERARVATAAARASMGDAFAGR